MNRELRLKVYNKFGGKCAYSGTILEDDWQVDHLLPKYHFEIGIEQGDPDDIKNLMPVQKLINHYKRGFNLDDFKKERMNKLHIALSKLPRKPRTKKSIKRINYMTKISDYFGIKENKPFNGKFYFEQL